MLECLYWYAFVEGMVHCAYGLTLCWLATSTPKLLSPPLLSSSSLPPQSPLLSCPSPCPSFCNLACRLSRRWIKMQRRVRLTSSSQSTASTLTKTKSDAMNSICTSHMLLYACRNFQAIESVTEYTIHVYGEYMSESHTKALWLCNNFSVVELILQYFLGFAIYNSVQRPFAQGCQLLWSALDPSSRRPSSTWTLVSVCARTFWDGKISRSSLQVIWLYTCVCWSCERIPVLA